mmetsp:Transcript_1019/g.2991  ORF Transcript_1019/g.2991 Transcript_1019/m.2991 type:complete len:227 (+) Transcript_1019:769-1449(+)
MKGAICHIYDARRFTNFYDHHRVLVVVSKRRREEDDGDFFGASRESQLRVFFFFLFFLFFFFFFFFFRARGRRRRRRRFWWTRKKTMHDDDRARRRRRTIFPKLWPVVLQSSIFPHKKKLLHLHKVSVSHQSRYFRWWCVSRIMVSSSSRVLFARVPSISFPVRMVDGVRVTGVQHSASSSSSSSFYVRVIIILINSGHSFDPRSVYHLRNRMCTNLQTSSNLRPN